MSLYEQLEIRGGEEDMVKICPRNHKIKNKTKQYSTVLFIYNNNNILGHWHTHE